MADQIIAIRTSVTLPRKKDELLEAYQVHYANGLPNDEHLDKINQMLASNAYRVKHRIPFPEELKSIRHQYGLSANAMSLILGLGINQYRLFENGELPSVSVGRLLSLIKEPERFFDFAKESDLLEPSEIRELAARVREMETQRQNHRYIGELTINKLAVEKAQTSQPVDAFRLFGMMAFFASEVDSLYKTALNKLLFYADFLHFKKTGKSISGWPYVAIDFGPVPNNFQALFGLASSFRYINIELVPVGKGQGELILPYKQGFENALFDHEEIGTLKQVAQTFGKLTVGQLVDQSHKEKAWKENRDKKGYINYPEYAFGINYLETKK